MAQIVARNPKDAPAKVTAFNNPFDVFHEGRMGWTDSTGVMLRKQAARAVEEYLKGVA